MVDRRQAGAVLTGLARAGVGAGVLLCVLAAVLSCLAGCNFRMDAVNHAAPFWIVGHAVCAVAVQFALPAGPLRRWVFLALALGVAPFLARVWPETVAALQRPAGVVSAEAPRLRVVWLNTLNRNQDYARLQAYLLATDADLIAVGERDVLDLAFFGPLAARYPHKLDCPHGRWCGVSILSKRAPRAQPASAQAPAEADQEAHVLRQGLRFAAAEFPVGADSAGPAFALVAVHMRRPTDGAGFTRDLSELGQLGGNLRAPGAVWIGDFNATPWSNALAAVDAAIGLPRLTRALATWPALPATRFHIPAPAPVLPIDHAYAGPAWRVERVRAGPPVGSDHLPIEVTLAWVGAAEPAPGGR